MARVLVTGANGHIGSNTVRSLMDMGHEVLPFVRPTSDLRGIEKLGLQYRYGDVRDYQSLADAVRGCDAVVHHAAVYKAWAKNPEEEIVQPGVEGTRNIFKACAEEGVGRLVYTSSVVAAGWCVQPGECRCESDWCTELGTPYVVEKVHGEREAVRLSEELDVPTVRILPAGVQGWYDYRITPSTRVLADLVNGKSVTFGGGTNWVDVRDVGYAHAAAVEKGEPGQRYIVSGDNISYRDAGAVISEVTGKGPRHVSSSRLVRSVSRIQTAGTRLLGGEPFATPENVNLFLDRYFYYDNRRARDTFGLDPRPAGKVVEESVRWLLFMGEIKPGLAEKIGDRLPPDQNW